MKKTLRFLRDFFLSMLLLTFMRPSYGYTDQPSREAMQGEYKKFYELAREGFRDRENIKNIFILLLLVLVLIVGINSPSLYGKLENSVAQRQLLATLQAYDISDDISRVTVETDKPELVRLIQRIDYKKIIRSVTVTLSEDSVHTEAEFAEKAYALTQIMKAEINELTALYVRYRRGGFSYDIKLTGDKLNLTADEMLLRIHTIGYPQ